MATVTAKGRNSSPVTPETTATGRNTATVVAVDAVTAPATSLTEATMSAGVSAACPVSRRLMFSSTTIESSTTRPTATVSAARVKMFSENPPTCRPIMATSSDSGMEMAVISVERTDIRNSRITRTANPSPSAPSTVRSWIDCSISGAWSKTMVNVALLPIVCCRPGSASVDGVRDGHRVAVGLLEHRHAQRRSPVGPGQRGGGDRLDLDVGDLGQRDRTVAGRDREGVDLLDRVGGVTHLHGQLEGLVVRGAGRDHRQLRLDRLGDGGSGEVALGQVVGPQGDGQLGGVLAGDLDLAYALDRGQGRDGHVLHQLARGRQRQIGRGGQQQHRDVVGAAGDDIGLDARRAGPARWSRRRCGCC